MGTSYSVLPLNESTRNWLGRLGVSVPSSLAEGRYPTPNEIRTTLETLQEYEVSYVIGESNWQAEVTDAKGRWASLVVLEFQTSPGSEDEPHSFYFDAGWEEPLQAILEALTSKCGPLVYFSNADVKPRLIVSPY